MPHLKNHATRLAALAFASILAANVSPAADPPTLFAQAEAAYAKQDYINALTLYQKSLGDPQDEKQIGAIKSKMAICRINLGPANPGAATAPASQPARSPHDAPKPHEVRTMDIKQLGNFDYDPERGGNIPADVRQLGGLHVRLTGFMVPLRQTEHITEFALVPSIFSCCYGAPPQVQHTILVHCPEKSPVPFCADLVEVDGVLKVEEKREEGFTVSLFEVAAQGVKPSDVKATPAEPNGKKVSPPDSNPKK